MFELIKAWYLEYRIALMAGALLALSVASFSSGCQITSWRYQSKESKQLKADVVAVKQDQADGRVAAKAAQVQEEKTRIIYRTIKEKAHEVATGNFCLNDRSVELWNSALQGVPDSTAGAAETAIKPNSATIQATGASAQQVLR